jgi:hypothetical protein
MPLDTNAFLAAALAPREQAVEVPELAAWFGEGEPEVWTVRGLTAAELGRAKESCARGLENVRALVVAMAGEGRRQGHGDPSRLRPEHRGRARGREPADRDAGRGQRGAGDRAGEPRRDREAGGELSDDVLPALEHRRCAHRAGGGRGKAEALWSEPGVRAAAYLCAERGRFLYEARPDHFPAGYLTDTEIAVWGLFYKERAARSATR